MTRASPILTAFNAGEMSPTLDGRVDVSKMSVGCKRLENFIPLIQGPAMRRAGTRFVMETKSSADRVWLLKFEFSATDAYVLEIGDQYIRFFTDHGYLQTGAVTAWSNATAYVVGDLASRLGVNYYCIADHTNQQPPNATYWYPLTSDIYEIPAPWLLADLTNADGTCALSTEQSGDVLYIANATGAYPVQKLIRYADTNWALEDYQPTAGPFLSANEDSTTIYASAVSGSVTLTASADLFAATDVGRLVRLEPENIDIASWENAEAYTANDETISDSKTYRALNTDTSGPSAPVHEYGSAYDGISGVQWQYIHSGYGIARITAYSSPTSVTAEVQVDTTNGLSELPSGVVTSGNPTTRWRLGAWSDTTGHPSYLAFWQNRLWFGEGQYLAGSVPDDFENMSEDFFNEVTLDCALYLPIPGQDVNAISWLIGADKLAIGTGGGEFMAGEITNTQAIGPGNFKIVRQSKRRCRAIPPIIAGESICYVQRAGRKLLAMSYAITNDKYVSSDLVVLAERITRTGIVWMTYQAEPYSIIWFGLTNGALRGFTYDQNQDVTGGHRHPVGGSGLVESGASIPSPDGSREELWVITRRTINGQTKRFIEYFEKPWEGEDEDGTPGDDQEDAFYVDSGLTYDGAPNDVISGLDHLEGETVQVLADGAAHPDCVVSSGSITLNAEYSVVQVGLKYTSRLVTGRIEAGSQDGTSQGKTKRINGMTLRFLDTLGGTVGMYGGENAESLSLRSPSTPMNQAPRITSGDYNMRSFPGGYETDCRIEVIQDQPLPMTLAALMPRLKTSDG